jgi:hypothetical protein
MAAMRIGAAAALDRIAAQKEILSAALPREGYLPRSALGEVTPNPAVRSVETGMAAPSKERYIFTGKSERETVTEREHPPLPATPQGYIDYDAIYRHVEGRLGEAVACSRAGF